MLHSEPSRRAAALRRGLAARPVEKEQVVHLLQIPEYANADVSGLQAELCTNKQTRKEKTDAVEILHAEVDQLEASIAKFENEADYDAMNKGVHGERGCSWACDRCLENNFVMTTRR